MLGRAIIFVLAVTAAVASPSGPNMLESRASADNTVYVTDANKCECTRFTSLAVTLTYSTIAVCMIMPR